MSDIYTDIYSDIYAEQGLIAPAPSTDRHLSFRYELLDADNVHKAWLEGVMGGWVGNNALAEIKRTARFKILDTDDIDWLSDRIKPWVTLNDEARARGVFLLSSPTRQYDDGFVIRGVEAYDQAIILREDKVDSRYTVSGGANVIAEARLVLESAGITEMNLTPTDKTFPGDRDWDPGTSKLRIFNDMMGLINYRSLYFDETGQAIAEPYVSPSVASPRHTYADDDDSVIFPEVSETLDLYDVANKWVLYTSEPDQTSLRSVYTNENPNSPTSTVSRGRTIVDYRQVEAADQAALEAIAERLAFEASQVYTSVEMRTAIMPTHGEADVIDFTFSHLGISDRYAEHTWEHELRAGAQMSHRIRKVIQV